VLARQDVTVLSADDPEVESLTLFWVAGRRVQPAARPVPRASDAAATALDELLWGPGPADPPDLLTALPTVEDVLTYHGRQADWGPRVQLRGLTIADGIATADFSPELGAYGGGSTRVDLIEQQITRTLEQFPGIRSVRIAVEGTTRGVLQP
jgi:spore germination protein GerM